LVSISREDFKSLLLFAKKFKGKLGWVIVQKDGATAHTFKYLEEVYEF
jgi:Holliday junction resolvase